MEVGVDIVSVERIKKALENEAFKNRVFTAKEIAYCESKKNKFESYAVRFAAKEAFSKAMGTGFIDLEHKDIEILNDSNGKPSLYYKNKVYKISLSHEKEYAIACFIGEIDAK